METPNTNEKEPVSFRFHKRLNKKLAHLAKATGRSKTFLAEEAIEQYCDLQSWQVKAINKGLKAADDGRFVSHEKIRKKWERKRENLLD